MSNPVNKRLGDYEILNVLGSGGMGRVYKVRNVITDRVEAMKVLLPDLQGHEEVAARFLREIKVLAGLKHPHIAALLTALTIENQLVMVMEYVEGQSVSSRLDSGPIPVQQALKYLDQVLDALSYAHRKNVIHRDIKPANMMLAPDGTVKLMDFGIARSSAEPKKLTATGSTLGSLNYMSPEQVKGEPTDERSDLYSLGISFYEMVTGEKPFRGDSDFSIMAAQINQVPAPPVSLQPGLPKLVNDIILKSIAKAPDQRFQSADAFRSVVKRALQSMQNDVTLVQGSEEILAPASAMDAMTFVQGSAENTVPSQSAQSSARTAAAVTARSTMPPSTSPPAQPPPMPPPQPVSHRGLYMALGASLVLIVLVAAGFYMPKWKHVSAADSAKPSQTAIADQKPAESKPEVTNPPVVQPKPEVRQKNRVAQNMLPGGAAAAPAGPDPAELDAAEHQIDQLNGRAAAVNSGLDNLQRQQQAEGYGLRGDIVSKQASMKTNLAKAQNAIEHNDLARAKRYADLTAADLDDLERFLGR